MRLLCICDPLTKIPGDTTVALYNRLAEDRRIEFYHLEASQVGPEDEIPVQRMAAPLSFQEYRALAANPTSRARYTDFDLVYSRSDKPFPSPYLPGLIRQERRVRFVARPSSVLECDLRTFTRDRLSPFLPPGLVTRSVESASAFIRATGTVVVKRNRSYGGKGVRRIRAVEDSWVLDDGDSDIEMHARLESIVESVLGSDPDPFEFVRFLPNVGAGDKRVIVVEGEIHGAVLRLSGNGSWINNLSRGGRALAAEVTEKERKTIEATCGMFHERGLYVLGYDFLQDDDGQWILSEINPGGNIGGYPALERTTGLPVLSRLIDWLLDFGAR